MIHTDNSETLKNALAKIAELELNNTNLKGLNRELCNDLASDNAKLAIAIEALEARNKEPVAWAILAKNGNVRIWWSNKESAMRRFNANDNQYDTLGEGEKFVELFTNQQVATVDRTINVAELHNIDDHKAYVCDCGCVEFNLLKSHLIECSDCQLRFGYWNKNIEANHE
jgi:hypothetical protein